ncbi:MULTISPECIES: RagB/SusD family nutrient uptake outer membrane protein [Butyricimonas]|uniref:RagB/SusD family nutrient uptake outer membrane protein n=1 Tax=Butyricimonas TaxID=574697 RepID=UPI000AEEACF1|nr:MULTISPECIES: RagB/SusD family nutrient uptake outer membrane protein [Butyricimonas]
MKHILLILCSVTWLFGCSNYLDVVPERDIETIESIFELRANADTWLEGVYAGVMKQVAHFERNPAFFGADETIMCDVFRNEKDGDRSAYNGLFIAEGLQMSQEPYGNLWDDNLNSTNAIALCSHYESIRNVNVFLEHIDGVYNMEEREKREWKAEMLALKAFLYFDLVRHYGPIALVPKNISVETSVPDMAVDRVHVDTCFREIVRLLDEAEPNLLLKSEKSSVRYAYFTKEAALVLKAKVLLYAASPLFNGNEYYANFKGKNGEPLFSSEYDPEKWRLAAEAADRAVEVCEAGQHKLYDGTASEGSVLLNTMYDLSHSVLSQFDNPEMILEWKEVVRNSDWYYHYLVLPRLSSSDQHYNQRAKGGICPTIKMVEMYYTENGLPIDVDNTWNYSGRYQMAQESSPRYTNVVPLKTDVL